jgi:hypothetical protein
MTVEPREVRDFEGRALWLGLVGGLVTVFRASARGFSSLGGGGHVDFQLVLYALSLVAFGLSVALCVLLVVPEWRAKLGPRVRQERPVYTWAFALFAVGVVLTVIAFVEGAIDALGEETQFG